MDRWEHVSPTGQEARLTSPAKFDSAQLGDTACMGTPEHAEEGLGPAAGSRPLPPTAPSPAGSYLLLLVSGVRLGLNRHLVILADGPDEAELRQHAEEAATSGRSECGAPTRPAFSATRSASRACASRHFRSGAAL
jgi:hypothetical protein